MFNELSEKDSSVSIHERNLQALAIETYKISNGLSRPLMKDIFSISNKHSVSRDWKYLESWTKNMGSGTKCSKRDKWVR